MSHNTCLIIGVAGIDFMRLPYTQQYNHLYVCILKLAMYFHKQLTKVSRCHCRITVEVTCPIIPAFVQLATIRLCLLHSLM